MGTRGRTRRPRTSARLWTVLVVLVSVVATVGIHAQLPFGFLHRGSTDKAPVEQCFRCQRWDACWIGDRRIEIPRAVVYSEWLWEAFSVFAATFEVLVRGFTLGFGIRMLKYLFWEPHHGNTTQTSERERRARFVTSFRGKALVSAVAGLSLAAFLHGSSIVFPAQLREEWFSYNNNNNNNNHHHHHHHHGSSTTLPLALYRYIQSNVGSAFLDASGIFVCPSSPSNCTDEVCGYGDPHSETAIGSFPYACERIGAGLVFLATTLEVLLRGFFLGFGAMMLKFLFVPERTGDGERPQTDGGHGSSESPSVADQNERDAGEEWTDLVQTFRYRAIVSSWAGISIAAVVHGSSIFVPSQLRYWWLDYDSDHNFDDFEQILVLAAVVAVQVILTLPHGSTKTILVVALTLSLFSTLFSTCHD